MSLAAREARMRGPLVIAGIEKSFGPVSVLRGVSLEARVGEVHAVLGENGAGKSTLMRILIGMEQADKGTMTIGGMGYAPRGPEGARIRGIVMVPQERTLCPHLTVVENIVLGIEPTGAGGVLKREEARAIAGTALALVAGEGRIALDVATGRMGVADQQLIEIARALAQGGVGDGPAVQDRAGSGGSNARVLILDEPTASLGKSDAERLFERVRALKEAGLAIVLVTHFLSDVHAHADRYTVLRDGTVQGAGEPRSVASEQIVHEMLGRELETVRGESGAAHAAAVDRGSGRGVEGVEGVEGLEGVEGVEGDTLLEVRGVAGRDERRGPHGAATSSGATFILKRGEILGIAGLVGSGRTELLRAILGLDRVRSGEVIVRAPRGIGLLSEDRGGEGLMLARSIGDNIELSRRGPFVVLPSVMRAEAAKWIAQLAVRASGPGQRVADLSGGNQQKVQIARLLREDFDVLLVDEPTRGIDVASKAQVLGLLRELARGGKGIVLVSSQLDELVSTCDRIAVLKRGELGASRPASSWDEQKLLLEAAS